MNETRRRLLGSAAGLLATGAALPFGRPALAQPAAFPAKPITLFVASTPGGALDTMGRVIADAMSKEIGQQVIIDYKPGAGGMLAAGHIARVAPDGYTLLLTTTAPLFYAPHMKSNLNYDAKKDITYISQVTDGGLIMLAANTTPATNMKELVAWVRSQGKDKVTYGSYGTGTVSHLLSAYLSESRDLGMTHVPYKGEAPFMTDLAGGHVPLGIGSIWTAAPQINSGLVKGIAIFSPERHPMLPNVPTLAESGFNDPDFHVVSGNFLVGPAHMPSAVQARIEGAIRRAMAQPAVREKFLGLGTTPVGGSSEEAQKTFDSTQPRLARLVKISGATLD